MKILPPNKFELILGTISLFLIILGLVLCLYW